MIFICIVALTHIRFFLNFYICCFVIVNIRVIFFSCFASVMRKQVIYQCTHTMQFMLSRPTEERSVLYLFTKFEVDSSIRSEVIRGPKFRIGSHDVGHAYLVI